jgi:hypothetical protein
MSGLSTFNETHPSNVAQVLDNALGTGTRTWDAPGFADWRVDAVFATNTDSIDHVVDVFYVATGTPVLWFSVNVPAGSGVGSVPPVNLLAGLATPYNLGFPLTVYDSLQLANEVSATVSGSVYVLVFEATL